jgi:hypothetical protein
VSTLEQLTDRVDTLLHGYTVNMESTTWLTGAITTTTQTTISVNDANVVSRGFIQIGDEIMYVNSTNNIDNILTLAPWGRAQRGTLAVTHDNSSKVMVSPLFPRFEIKRAINDTLNSMYPSIFAIGQYQFPYIAARTTYDLPDVVENVLSVTHHVIGPSKEWLPVRAWQLDRTANPGEWGTGGNFGKTLGIYSAVVPGRTVNVAFSKRPTLFNITALPSVNQEYSTVTGMPDYSEDVVIYGAAFRMISFLDPSRLGALSAEADVLDNQRGPRSGENASRFLFNVYNTRLNEVAENQRRQFPIRSHYQR